MAWLRWQEGGFRAAQGSARKAKGSGAGSEGTWGGGPPGSARPPTEARRKELLALARASLLTAATLAPCSTSGEVRAMHR